MKEENGQVSLHPSSPFVFIKSPWHGSMALHLSILIGGALLFLIVSLRWLGSFFSGLLRHEPRPVLGRLARLIGGLFALAYLAFFVVLLAAMLDINPAYGVPNLLFETPSGFEIFMGLPLVLGVLAVLMAIFAVILWAKSFWTLRARLSYTFLTLLAFAILWSLAYWNFLL